MPSTRLRLPLLLLMTAVSVLAEKPVFIDGAFEDWVDKAPAGSVFAPQPSGEGEFQAEASAVYLAHSAEYLFLYFSNPVEFDLQEGNDLLVLIDADDNAATGTTLANLNIGGVDLLWRLGRRNGRYYPADGGASIALFHDDIGLVAAPTVTSRRFELALARDARPDGSTPLFGESDTIGIWVVRDQAGDPPAESTPPIRYELGAEPIPYDALDYPRPVRPARADIRVLSWNVLFEAFENPANHPAYGRVLAALDPDIIAFQEIVEFNATEVRTLVEGWLDPLPGGSWHATQNSDLRLVSRYPILRTWQLAVPNQGAGNQAVLLDTAARFGEDLLVIQCHFPFGDQEQERQNEADQIMAFLRDERAAPGSPITAATPVVILGDLNLVGLRRQLTTLLTGDIENETTYGHDLVPDVDGSGFRLARARHLARPFAYTWINPDGSFYPGVLDFQIHSDAVFKARNAFLLDSARLDAANLARWGLRAGDTGLSDHFPLVADFEFWPEGALRDALVNEAPDLGGGWRYNAWLGLYFPYAGGGWMFSPSTGPVFLSGYSDFEDVWLFFPELGWLWTRRSIMPYLYDPSETRWLYLDPNGKAGSRRVYDFNQGVWLALP